MLIIWCGYFYHGIVASSYSICCSKVNCSSTYVTLYAQKSETEHFGENHFSQVVFPLALGRKCQIRFDCWNHVAHICVGVTLLPVTVPSRGH